MLVVIEEYISLQEAINQILKFGDDRDWKQLCTFLFLTHCGMNSINEALCFGVPMVAMPFINDQVTNANQMTWESIVRRIEDLV